jgi:hypothetical protein
MSVDEFEFPQYELNLLRDLTYMGATLVLGYYYRMFNTLNCVSLNSLTRYNVSDLKSRINKQDIRRTSKCYLIASISGEGYSFAFSKEKINRDVALESPNAQSCLYLDYQFQLLFCNK